jgi:hypothetical protein
MRCKDVFVYDVWVDVYVTPFLYACSDQTSMLVLGVLVDAYVTPFMYASF